MTEKIFDMLKSPFRSRGAAREDTTPGLIALAGAEDFNEDIGRSETSSEYWTRVNVTHHANFESAAESIAYFHWRNMLYSGYIERMPVEGHEGKAIIDYGCGPGHDLVGFAEYSRPSRLVGVDVSPTSLEESRRRLKLHTDIAELVQIREGEKLPFEGESIDLIHSSGVLHHIIDPTVPVREFRRIIRPDGKLQIMIYNYWSVFVHLGIAYERTFVDPYYMELFDGLPLGDRFRKSTDGNQCPVSRYYRPEEFIALFRSCGFDGRYIGGGVAPWEMHLLFGGPGSPPTPPRVASAMQEVKLPYESRKFLYDLTYDEKLRPMYQGQLAGIDGCFEFWPV